jgi:hypothetical protein
MSGTLASQLINDGLFRCRAPSQKGLQIITIQCASRIERAAQIEAEQFMLQLGPDNVVGL